MTAAVHSLLRLACLVLAFGTLASCSSYRQGPGGEVSVKVYHLSTQQRFQPQTNRTIRFEQERHLYGAITNRQRTERNGQYYTALWNVKDRTQPVTVRFEYRKQNTGLKIFSKEQTIDKVRRRNATEFQVISKEFKVDGAVTSWRIMLLRGKEELAHANSFLWN